MKERDLLYIQPDKSLEKVYRMIEFKIDSRAAGQLVNDLAKDDRKLVTEPFTAMCKSDCILMRLDNSMFYNLRQQQLRKNKEEFGSELLKLFPPIRRFYLDSKINEMSTYIAKKVSMQKGRYVVKEGEKLENAFFILQEGKVKIQKKVDIKDHLRANLFDIDHDAASRILTHTMLEIHSGDFIGEDFVLKNQPSSYDAIVSSVSCKLIKINFHRFKTFFKRVIPFLRRTMRDRQSFLEEREKILKQQIEKGNIRLREALSINMQKELFLFKQTVYIDPEKETTNDRMKNIFIRQRKIEYQKMEDGEVDAVEPNWNMYGLDSDKYAITGVQEPKEEEEQVKVMKTVDERLNQIVPQGSLLAQASLFQSKKSMLQS